MGIVLGIGLEKGAWALLTMLCTLTYPVQMKKMKKMKKVKKVKKLTT